jgi:hypothetical protein
MSDLLLTYIPFKNFYLVYSEVGAGTEAASKLLPEAENFCLEPEPHKN